MKKDKQKEYIESVFNYWEHKRHLDIAEEIRDLRLSTSKAEAKMKKAYYEWTGKTLN